MRIRILWPGRTRQGYLNEGVRTYLGKLKPFADVEIVRIREERDGPKGDALRKEGERVLKKTSDFTLLDESGRGLDSLQFASYLGPRTRVDFVLGGAYGVSKEVRGAASDVISLSPMTLTHEMARLLLLEQIYRALMINAGRGYHH
jgi:23S rRNA (pseudouridine1915-N3)-methyltransferase